MITYKQIVEEIEEVFFVVRDSNGDIVNPTEKSKLEKYKQIINGISYDNEYFIIGEKCYKRLIKPVSDKNNNYYFIEYFYNVSKTEHNEFDVDTKLYTKEATFKYINEYLIHAIRCRENFGVLFIDIDNFKLLNDTYGHVYCDQILSKIGEVIIKNTRHHDNKDIVGRVGGDEIVVLLKNIPKERCLSKAEVLINSISEIELKENKENKKLFLTVSIGLYYIDDYEYSEISNLSISDARKTIINRSDEAMYDSKDNGKNIVSVYQKKLIKD